MEIAHNFTSKRNIKLKEVDLGQIMIEQDYYNILLRIKKVNIYGKLIRLSS